MKRIKILIILITSTLLFLHLNGETKTLKIMAMNTWHGGKQVKNGIEKIANIIEKIDPDIVSFSEIREEDWTKNLVEILKKKQLKYEFKFLKKSDVSLISKYPIKDASIIFQKANSAVKYTLTISKHTLVVVSTHLDFKSYASNLPRGYNTGSKKYPKWGMINNGKGKPKPITDVNIILKNNATSERENQISMILKEIKNETAPIIIVGDFNEPSFLDWTTKTKNLFAHNGTIIEWPSTKILYNNGFTDAFRKIYPDEVKNPGITWPSLVTGHKPTTWAPLSDDRDRIDYIFYKGKKINPISFAIVGPKESYAYKKLTKEFTKNENFLATDMPWPSDHKSIMAKLKITW